MGNLINLPNITFDSLVVEGQKKTTEKKTNTFDAKNYLNTRLSDGEKEKTFLWTWKQVIHSLLFTLTM